jgi:hypothetical protein
VRGHPVAGLQHVASDLRLHRIHIVHEGGRRYNAAKENRGREENDNEFTAELQSSAETVTSFLPAASGSGSV